MLLCVQGSIELWDEKMQIECAKAFIVPLENEVSWDAVTLLHCSREWVNLID